MAAGQHLQVLEAALDKMSAEVMFGESAAHHPLAADDLQRPQTDLETARQVLETELKTKCDYWLRLP